MKPNTKLNLKISELGINGDGIARINDKFVVYVNNAIPGDEVKANVTDVFKTYAHAEIVSVQSPSKFRVKTKCSKVNFCGGCQIQQMDYKQQLVFKQNLVKNNIENIAQVADYEMFDALGCGNVFRFRNKALIPFGVDNNGKIVAGFFAKRSHEIIDCQDCVIGVEENQLVIETIISHLEKYRIKPYDEKSHEGVFRYVLIRKAFATNELMVSLILNSDKIDYEKELVESLISKLPTIKSVSINMNTENTNVIKGSELRNIFGEGYITDFIGDIKFKISPLSFYQVNSVQTKLLYNKALEFANLKGDEVIFDLYCGVGTISLFLAKHAKKVYGVEILPQAIDDANENARINAIENAEFICGKSELVVPELIEKQGVKADVVVVDPPRKGCDKSLLQTIITMKPKKLVYVSCDSSTLARDIKVLTISGFKLKKVQPVDMFPHSVHIETVALLTME